MVEKVLLAEARQIKQKAIEVKPLNVDNFSLKWKRSTKKERESIFWQRRSSCSAVAKGKALSSY